MKKLNLLHSIILGIYSLGSILGIGAYIGISKLLNFPIYPNVIPVYIFLEICFCIGLRINAWRKKESFLTEEEIASRPVSIFFGTAFMEILFVIGGVCILLAEG